MSSLLKLSSLVSLSLLLMSVSSWGNQNLCARIFETTQIESVAVPKPKMSETRENQDWYWRFTNPEVIPETYALYPYLKGREKNPLLNALIDDYTWHSMNIGRGHLSGASNSFEGKEVRYNWRGDTYFSAVNVRTKMEMQTVLKEYIVGVKAALQDGVVFSPEVLKLMADEAYFDGYLSRIPGRDLFDKFFDDLGLRAYKEDPVAEFYYQIHEETAKLLPLVATKVIQATHDFRMLENEALNLLNKLSVQYKSLNPAVKKYQVREARIQTAAILMDAAVLRLSEQVRKLPIADQKEMLNMYIKRVNSLEQVIEGRPYFDPEPMMLEYFRKMRSILLKSIGPDFE